jgi:hypothetical protein
MKKPKATENKAKDVVTKTKLEIEAQIGRLQIARERLAAQQQEIIRQMQEAYKELCDHKGALK